MCPVGTSLFLSQLRPVTDSVDYATINVQENVLAMKIREGKCIRGFLGVIRRGCSVGSSTYQTGA